MSHFDEHLPEDVRDIAERLTEARATLSPLESDELRGRVRRRVGRSSKERRFGGLRRSWLAGILAGTLMLSSGAGVVVAAGYFGGGDSHVFDGFSFRHDRDSSFCQYHGPVTITRVIPTFFGLLIITITFDCGHVISVHISFIPFHFPPHHHGDDDWFGWRFGDGPEQTTKGPSVSTTAPSGTTAMTITANGSSYTFPISVSGPSTPGTPNPSVSVAFDANGGTGGMATETDNAPTALTADGFTRAGYTFAGWNTAANGGGTSYADGATYAFTSSATLYAQWKATVKLGVAFNANGGTGGMASETSSVPAALTADGFTRTGYTFAGWNTAPNGSGNPYADGATYAFTANATLYAQWTPTRHHRFVRATRRH